jgi:Arc/MetJ-type ribon-helix-helix transcriptional regulator
LQEVPDFSGYFWQTRGECLSAKDLYGQVSCITSRKKRLNGDIKVSDGNKRERITIRLTKRYLDLLNMLIEKGVYNSRNEAIRDALRIMYEYHGLKVSPEKKHAFNQSKADDASKEQD